MNHGGQASYVSVDIVLTLLLVTRSHVAEKIGSEPSDPRSKDAGTKSTVVFI